MVKGFGVLGIDHGGTKGGGERLWARGERVRKSHGERVEGEGLG